MKRIKYYLFITIFQLFVLLPIWGQSLLSLTDAIETGLNNNYQIDIAQRDLEIAVNNNDWAIAGKYPTVNALLNLNNGYTNNNNPASFLTELSSVSTGLNPVLEANLVLFDGYRIRFTKNQLEQLENLERGSVKIAVENTVQSIILAYQAALIEAEQLKVLEEVLLLSRDRIDYQEVRQEFGQGGSFDLLQAQDAYINDTTSYLIQQNTLATAMRNLNLTMGVDDLNKRYTLSDALDFSPKEYSFEDLQAKMINSNQSLQNLLINRELADVNLRLQEASKYPTISASAGLTYNYNLSSGSGTLSNGESLTLDAVTQKTFNGFLNFTASYNIFNGGARRKRIENAQTEALITNLNIEDLKRNLRSELMNTLATYNNQKDIVMLTSQLLDNAQQNLAIAEERFKGGLINSFDYRSIQLSFINAAQARLSAIFNLKNTETSLIKLTGGLVR